MQAVKTSRIEYITLDTGVAGVTGTASRFEGQTTDEYHLVLRPDVYAHAELQTEWLLRAYQNSLTALGIDPDTAVFRRFLCSDLSNQLSALENASAGSHDTCAVSWVRQPPAPPAKVVLWAYHVNDRQGPLDKALGDDSLTLKRGEMTHMWTTGMTCPAVESSHDQTRRIFTKYDGRLKSHGLTLADNVLRTWLFVQNIDLNYHGLVTARRDFFAERGLTAETHFIASTGIEGAHKDVAAKVAMDAYAVGGVRPQQIEYLAALDHLSPTHIYGVTFERGTAVTYQDRKHIIISGTASIDHQGKTLYPGDVARQFDRTVENIQALLAQAGARLSDMGLYIAYVRDVSDQQLVQELMREHFGCAPLEVVVAPVCRPGWLIEIEGMGLVSADRQDLPAF